MLFEFFRDEITEEKIREFLENKEEEDVFKTIKQAVELLGNMVQFESSEEALFFHNYEKLIQIYSESETMSANTMVTHWINTYAQRCIQNQNTKKAKSLYKLLRSLAPKQMSEPLFLCNGLSNLSLLYKMQGKYEQSIQITTKTITITFEYLEQQKNRRSKKELCDYAVILVHACAILKRNLLKASLNLQMKSFKLDFLERVNGIGLRTCLHYLGKGSQFVRYFDPVKQNPIKKVNRKIDNLQSFIVQKLESIEELLRNRPQEISETEIYAEQSEQSETASKSSEQEQQKDSQKEQQKKQQVPKPLEKSVQKVDSLAKGLLGLFAKGKKVDEELVEICGWSIRLELTKMFAQKIGKLQIHCRNQQKNIEFTKIIQPETLEQILQFQNLEDTIPYEYSLESPPINFISICVRPFLSITQDGELKIFSRSKGILSIWERIFMGYSCSVCINHIKYNQFRVAIWFQESSDTLYLNIFFSEHSMNQFFDLTETTNGKVFASFKQICSPKTKFRDSKQKVLKICDRQGLQVMVDQIVSNFAKFLKSDLISISHLSEIVSEESAYYKFEQIKGHIGTFFKVMFRPSVVCFEIYAENSFIVEQGQKRLQGFDQFSKRQFQEAFGIQLELQELKPKLKKLCEIISLRYSLPRSRKRQLNESRNGFTEEAQNCLIEEYFNFHCFKLKHVSAKQNKESQHSGGYMNPITASIVTVQNRIPVGIKVSKYDFERIEETGFFIPLEYGDWRESNFVEQQYMDILVDGDITSSQIVEVSCVEDSKQLSNVSEKGENREKFQRSEGQKRPKSRNTMFVKYEKNYKLNDEYFVSEWMQKKGFESVLKRCLQQDSPLYIEKNRNKFLQSNDLFED